METNQIITILKIFLWNFRNSKSTRLEICLGFTFALDSVKYIKCCGKISLSKKHHFLLQDAYNLIGIGILSFCKIQRSRYSYRAK
jgi:hypothetical protein